MFIYQKDKSAASCHVIQFLFIRIVICNDFKFIFIFKDQRQQWT